MSGLFADDETPVNECQASIHADNPNLGTLRARRHVQRRSAAVSTNVPRSVRQGQGQRSRVKRGFGTEGILAYIPAPCLQRIIMSM